MKKDQSLITNTGVVRNLHNHLAAGFVGVHMAFPQSKDRHSVAGEVVVEVHKGRRMGVVVEDNPPCVAVEGFAVRSHPDRNSPVAWLVGSVRDSVVEGCNHAGALFCHTHPWEGSRDEEANGSGKGPDREHALLRVGPIRNKIKNEIEVRNQQRTSATHVT